MNKVSVYGATGFIGNRYCEKFPDEIIKIHKKQLVSETDNILYFISTVDNYNIFKDPFVDIRTNLIHLMSVLETCKSRNLTFNFISSWFVYGDLEFPVNEETICEPKGFYSITKRTAEQLLISYCKTFKINYRIIRLSNIVGTTDTKTSFKKNFLQNTINQLKLGSPITIFSEGQFERDYLYVDDACDAINLILSKGNLNEIFNVSSANPVKFIDVVDYIKNYLKSNSEIFFKECPEQFKDFQIMNCKLDNTKLKNLGFKPSLSIYEVIEKLCQ